MIENIIKDIRHALRVLGKSSGFTLATTLSLAFGIGGTTMIFTVVNAVLLRPLAYHDSDRIVWVWSERSSTGVTEPVSYPDFLDWKARSKTLDSWAAWGNYETILTGIGSPQRLQAALMMGSLFTLLGVPPMLGSTAAAENVDPRVPTVVLSHALWKRAFSADPSVIGRQVVLSGLSYTVIAVIPAGFRFPIQSTPQVDLWMPLARFNPALANKRDARLSDVLARVRPNVPLRQAQAEMDTIAAQLREDYPKTNHDIAIRIVPALDQVTGGAGHGLLIIFASVGALLLIACTNIANLHLVRAVARQREISIRASLGASRVRIGSQLITEGLILAMIGGLAGLLVAASGVQVLRTFIPPGLPRVDEITVDSHVLVFAFLLAS
jgi:predicted permease